MSEYRLVVTRIDKHPKAGQRIPCNEMRGYSQFGCNPETYPDTSETKTLEVVLSDAEYSAAKAAIVGAHS